jgi:hypothetical protein
VDNLQHRIETELGLMKYGQGGNWRKRGGSFAKSFVILEGINERIIQDSLMPVGDASGLTLACMFKDLIKLKKITWCVTCHSEAVLLPRYIDDLQVNIHVGPIDIFTATKFLMADAIRCGKENQEKKQILRRTIGVELES